MSLAALSNERLGQIISSLPLAEITGRPLPQEQLKEIVANVASTPNHPQSIVQSAWDVSLRRSTLAIVVSRAVTENALERISNACRTRTRLVQHPQISMKPTSIKYLICLIFLSRAQS